MRYLIAVGLVCSLFSLISCKTELQKNVLPYYGNFENVYSTVDGKQVVDSIYPTIPAFSYLNQDSIMVKSTVMKGKVWIADFFFSTCPSICPTMTTQMKRLNIMTDDINEQLQYMSFSINPNYDQPHILQRYIKLHGIEADNWHFFTGDEDKTHKLGIENFMVFAEASEEAPGGYAHSESFVLVDREGYVRGVYMGTDTEQVNRLEKDLRKLLKYEYGVE
ncbi:MAG: protein SCO1/2 [Crocinitomicaceae bacterium]|jgi:protein SCO1/2